MTWITLGGLLLLVLITLTSFISWYLWKQRQVQSKGNQNIHASNMLYSNADQLIQEMNPSYEQNTNCLPKICVKKIKQGKQIGKVIQTYIQHARYEMLIFLFCCGPTGW